MPLAIMQGLRFNGITDYLDMGNSNKFDLTDSLTVEQWVYNSDDFTEFRLSILKGDNTNLTTGDMSFAIRINSGANNQINFNIYTSSRQSMNYNGLPKNQWVHVAMTYDGSLLRGYINGVVGVSMPVSGNLRKNTASLKIGGTPTINRWKGQIGESRIYNRTLSSQEITSNYNGSITRQGLIGEWLMNEGQGSKVNDTSGNSNNGTIVGASWIIKKAGTPKLAKR